MAARTRIPVAAFLRVGLLAGILAIVAGLLGMHVLAGFHGTDSHRAHASTEHVAVEGPAAHHETPTPPSCGCGGGCGEQHTAHASCTPAPSGASLSAPLPGTTLLAVQPRSAAGMDQPPGYSYFPATPTPSELSISRT